MRHIKQSAQVGVTLIELMIVLVILAIVAAIALPAYDDSVLRARRSEAREVLSDLAARQEQFFLDNVTYAASPAALGRNATTESGYYVVSIPTVTAVTYTLRATAQGSQGDDTPCATIDLTSTGSRAPVDCW